jgi:hypothetical protein
VREQLVSPGQRLAGVRTVDRRTGRRVALWRTLVLVGVRTGGQLAAARLAPPVLTPERERAAEAMRAEVDEVRRKHRDDPAAMQAEMREVHARHRVPGPNLAAAIGPSLALAAINNRLQRRLAPIVEARAPRD